MNCYENTTDTPTTMTSNTDTEEESNAETDIVQPDSIDDQLDQALTTLTDHLNEIGEVIANIRDEEYGKFSVEINGKTWTLKHENGTAQWFRQSVDGNDRYILSTKGKPSPSDVAEAMEEYPQFVASVNNWVNRVSDSLGPTEDKLSEAKDLLDELDGESVVAERDRLEQEAWEVASAVGHAVQQVTGNDYGTFKTEMNGQTWKLKYQDGGSAKYLKVGDNYILGRDSPKPEYLNQMVQNIDQFIDNVNEWLEKQDQQTRLSIEITEVEVETDDNN